MLFVQFNHVLILVLNFFTECHPIIWRQRHFPS